MCIIDPFTHWTFNYFSPYKQLLNENRLVSTVVAKAYNKPKALNALTV